MTWLEGPMAGFDLETTAPDPEVARIVTACVGYRLRALHWDATNWVAAATDIPEEATAIHGVTQAYADEHGDDPARVAAEVRDALYFAWGTGMVVCGANISYDFTVLDRELRRHGLPPFEVQGPVLDSFVLDRRVDPYRKGKRTLTAACEHYRIELTEAHTAAADVLAATRLVHRICFLYQLDQRHTLDELTELQAGWHEERQRDFAAYLRRKGEDASGVSWEWPIRPYEQGGDGDGGTA